MTEEKRSDVNIAAHMVRDAAKSLFEVAVLISNDGDLMEPVKIVKEDFGLRVGILNPYELNPTVLKAHAAFIKRIRQADVAACQLPDVLTDSKGSFNKPSIW